MTDEPFAQDDKNAHLSPTLRGRLQQCYEFGNQKMQAGEHDYANEMFIQCVKGNPGNLIYLQTFVANLRLKYGDNKKGASFGKLKSGKHRTALKVAENRAKWSEVIAVGCELLKINPWDSSAYFAMGKAALELGYDDTGLALLKHAVECSPNDIEMNRFAAKELGDREMFEQAIACLQRILNVKSDDRDASKMLGDMMLQRTMKHMDRNKEARETSDAATETKKVNEEDQFEKKIRKNPEDRDLWLAYAEYYFQRANFRKAEDTYRRAFKQFPDDMDIALRLLEIQRTRSKEDLVRTKELYEKAPDDALKEKYLQQRQDFDKKNLALIQQKLKMNPTGTQVRYEYGIFLLSHGKFKEAIVELQSAQRDESIKADCYLAIAQCFEQVKQYKLAMDHYEKAVAAFGDSTGEPVKRALYLAARLAAALGDYKKAENHAGRLAAIDFSYKDVGALLDKIAKKLQN